VEVLSITTAEIDRTTKLKLYARLGVKEYWLIDPEECLAEVDSRKGRGLARVANLQPTNSLTTPLLPGFSVPLQKLVG
jgi:Uma2 family endonuclease